MDDELNQLQDTAAKARAEADELKAALTDESSEEEKTAADDAETAAVEAEKALADAQVAQPKAGDTCTLPDETEGVLTEQDGQLVCVSKEKPAIDPDASRTGVVKGPAKAGDTCTCPDGRTGTVAIFADGLAICLPNHDQG